MKRIVYFIMMLAVAAVCWLSFSVGRVVEMGNQKKLLKDYQISVDTTAITVYDRDRLVSVCNWDSCELSRIVERDNQ